MVSFTVRLGLRTLSFYPLGSFFFRVKTTRKWQPSFDTLVEKRAKNGPVTLPSSRFSCFLTPPPPPLGQLVAVNSLVVRGLTCDNTTIYNKPLCYRTISLSKGNVSNSYGFAYIDTYLNAQTQICVNTTTTDTKCSFCRVVPGVRPLPDVEGKS